MHNADEAIRVIERTRPLSCNEKKAIVAMYAVKRHSFSADYILSYLRRKKKKFDEYKNEKRRSRTHGEHRPCMAERLHKKEVEENPRKKHVELRKFFALCDAAEKFKSDLERHMIEIAAERRKRACLENSIKTACFADLDKEDSHE